MGGGDQGTGSELTADAVNTTASPHPPSSRRSFWCEGSSASEQQRRTLEQARSTVFRSLSLNRTPLSCHLTAAWVPRIHHRLSAPRTIGCATFRHMHRNCTRSCHYPTPLLSRLASFARACLGRGGSKQRRCWRATCARREERMINDSV